MPIVKRVEYLEFLIFQIQRLVLYMNYRFLCHEKYHFIKEKYKYNLSKIFLLQIIISLKGEEFNLSTTVSQIWNFF